MTNEQFLALPEHVKITLNGEEYWLNEHHLISPLDHFNELGDFLADWGDISYAVIEGNKIMRYGRPIAAITDLEVV